MIDLGPYASFILAAYAICTIVVLMLIVAVRIDYRRQRQILKDMEARGVSRRSAGSNT
jgi:heme exporter protein D